MVLIGEWISNSNHRPDTESTGGTNENECVVMEIQTKMDRLKYGSLMARDKIRKGGEKSLRVI